MELSVATGIDAGTLSMIERGVSEPKLQTAWAIAKAMGIPLETLCEWDPKDIITINRNMLNDILDSDGATYEPRGLFICKDTVDGEDVYTALKNLDGSGETEEFKSRWSAAKWLQGHNVGKRCLYRQKRENEDIQKIMRLDICKE